MLPESGVQLIKEFEGCHLTAYPDPLSGGRPYTIGWGSTRDFDGSPFQPGRQIDQEYADRLLAHDIEGRFLPSLEKIPVWPELNENQRGAILSFAYNLGANFYGKIPGFRTITRVLRDKQWEEIRDAFILYRNPGSNVEAGLRRRREAEAALFLTPVESEEVDVQSFLAPVQPERLASPEREVHRLVGLHEAFQALALAEIAIVTPDLQSVLDKIQEQTTRVYDDRPAKH